VDQGIELVELSALTAPGVEIALIDIERHPHLEDAADQFLEPDERARFVTLRSPHRRREWLAARVCAKLLAARKGLIAGPHEARIAQDRSGRPALVDPAGRAVTGITDCSLSHKGRFACACLGRPPIARVGIDIETVSPRLRSLRDAFVNPSDAMEFHVDTDADLALLWSLKEAYSKAIGAGIHIGLKNITSNRNPATNSVRVRTLAGRVAHARHVVYSNCVVAVCFIAQ
jgi:phosphopantetheinyl transferase